MKIKVLSAYARERYPMIHASQRDYPIATLANLFYRHTLGDNWTKHFSFYLKYFCKCPVTVLIWFDYIKLL